MNYCPCYQDSAISTVTITDDNCIISFWSGNSF